MIIYISYAVQIVGFIIPMYTTFTYLHYHVHMWVILLMKLKIQVTQEGKIFIEKENIKFQSFFRRYRQEAYIYGNKIFVFGGGGVSGISFSLENVSRS
jgi:hypothetical protein